jgi:hypothetical protein
MLVNYKETETENYLKMQALLESCPDNGDILSCPEVCSVSCKRCGQVSGCKGVDNGQNMQNLLVDLELIVNIAIQT